MGYKQKILLVGGLSLLWVLFETFVLCQPDPSDEYVCKGNLLGNLHRFIGDSAQILLLYPLVLFVLSLILLLVREEVFRSWARFAKWYLSIATILVLFLGFRSGGGSFLAGSMNFDAELGAWWTAGIFFIVSLIIITMKSWKSWKLRKGKQ